MRRRLSIALTLALSLAAPASIVHAETQPDSGARIWEEDLTLPTYLVGAPGKNPRFYF